MRQAVVLFAATAAALATPDLVSHQQISLSDKHDKAATQDAVQTWWNTCPEAEDLFSSVEQHVTKNIERFALDSFLSVVGEDDDEEDEDPHHPPHWPRPPRPPRRPHPPRRGRGRHGHHGPHGDPEKTIYELIKDNKHTTKFAKLVEEHDEIKALLQDTEHNHTLFVPTDRAFRRIPHHRHGHKGGDHDDSDSDSDDDGNHEHKPSKEFLLALLKYHITPGLYPLGRIHNSRTLPSELYPAALEAASSSEDEDSHGDHPQRIRAFTTPVVHFTRLNFYARLLGGDFVAKNGLIHAVDALLLPPPNTTAIIRLLPGHFSTLALALETTGLGEELDEGSGSRRGGGTLFAPTNTAWQRLGPKANAFLFSEKGRKYLKALVKYHVVVNETLYSDAFYSGKKKHEDGAGEKGEYWHVDLTSLLDGKPISVDVREWKGFVSIVVNGFVRVVVRDGIANDGVIQVVDKVLIPPCKHHDGGDEDVVETEMSVEDLKTRLEPYLKADNGPEDAGDL